jgi:hypothetical protein
MGATLPLVVEVVFAPEVTDGVLVTGPRKMEELAEPRIVPPAV